jgi:hypothetical protein
VIYHSKILTVIEDQCDKNWLLVRQDDIVGYDGSVPLSKIQQFVNPQHNNQAECQFEKLVPEHIKVTISTVFGFAAGQNAQLENPSKKRICTDKSFRCLTIAAMQHMFPLHTVIINYVVFHLRPAGSSVTVNFKYNINMIPNNVHLLHLYGAPSLKEVCTSWSCIVCFLKLTHQLGSWMSSQKSKCIFCDVTFNESFILR